MWYRLYGAQHGNMAPSLVLLIVVCTQNMWRCTEANIKLFTLRTLSSSMHPNVLKTSPNKHLLPIPPMMDEADFIKHKPKRKHMRTDDLLEVMGEDYNPAWMSMDKPYDNPQDAVVTIKRQVDTKLLPDLNELNFTYLDENGDNVPMKPHVQKAFEKWLLQKASCPVQFVWEDIGGLFWPRWVKQGICLNENSPCSWPPGMHCVPAESHTVNVLRWHCRRRNIGGKQGRRRGDRRGNNRRNNNRRDGSSNDNDDTNKSGTDEETEPATRDSVRKNRNKHKKNRLRCKWIKVPYPVTAECFCSC